MICPNCQKEIPDTARACGYCGHWLGGEKPTPPTLEPGPATRRNLPWLWIGLGVGVITVIGVITFLFAGSSGRVGTETTIATAVAATETARAVAVLPGETPVPPTNTPAPEPTNTSTLEPTNSPQPSTPTPIPPATIDTDPLVYDNFNNPANDGSYDKGRWDVYNPLNICKKVGQSEGALVFSMTTSKIEEGCFLNGPGEILGNRLDLFEAKMKVLDLKGEGLLTQLVLGTDSKGFSGGGWVSCGLSAYPGGGHAYFSINKQEGQIEEFHKEYPTQTNNWHTLRFAIDPNNMTFSCFVDDTLVGSRIPVDAEKIKTALVYRYIQLYLNSNSSATAFIDDVLVVP